MTNRQYYSEDCEDCKFDECHRDCEECSCYTNDTCEEDEKFVCLCQEEVGLLKYSTCPYFWNKNE